MSPVGRRRGIAVGCVSKRQDDGVLGVPARPGGRRKGAGSAVAARVAGIGSGYVSGGTRQPLKRPPRASARVSAQPRVWKNLPVPGRDATSCLFPRGAARISGSVRACAVRLYGACSSARPGGGGGVNGGRAVGGGFHRGARKYVVAHCRSLAFGPIVADSAVAIAAAILQESVVRGSRETGRQR